MVGIAPAWRRQADPLHLELRRFRLCKGFDQLRMARRIRS